MEKAGNFHGNFPTAIWLKLDMKCWGKIPKKIQKVLFLNLFNVAHLLWCWSPGFRDEHAEDTPFTWILLKKILSQMLSQRMIPLLTSAPFLLAAKLSSQRFSGVFAWLKICRGDQVKTCMFLSLSLFALGSVSPYSGCSTMTRKQEAALLTKQIWNTLAILTEPWTTFVLTTSLSPCRTCGWAVEAPQGKWSAAGPSCRLTVDGCRPGRSRSVLRGSTPPTSEKHTKIVLFVIALLIKHLSEQQHKHHTHGKGSGSSRQDHPLNIVVQWIGNFLAKDKIPH